VSQQYEIFPAGRASQDQFVKHVKDAVRNLTKAGFFLRGGVDEQVFCFETVLTSILTQYNRGAPTTFAIRP
jgi:hypothetical protein